MYVFALQRNHQYHDPSKNGDGTAIQMMTLPYNLCKSKWLLEFYTT